MKDAHILHLTVERSLTTGWIYITSDDPTEGLLVTAPSLAEALVQVPRALAGSMPLIDS